MLNHLRALGVFAKVAEHGSFRAAAKQLGISASVVSHHVTALETQLNTPLIYRTTRKLSLTAAGERLAVSARDMLKAAEDGFGEIYSQGPELKGHLKITAPAILQYARFVTRISTFLKQHRNVEISINFSDKRLNIVEQGFDLGFRVGQLEDSSLLSRKLADARLIVCASPDYLGSQGEIKVPEDLKNLEMIHFAGVSQKILLARPGDSANVRSVQLQHRILVNSGFAARRMAEQGCGIVMQPDFFVRKSIDEGKLCEVLPGWQAPSFGIYAVWPQNAGSNHVRNALLKFIVAIAKTGPEMDNVPVSL